MSKPRYRWWGYIRNVIRAYPELKKEYEELHQQSVTANTSGMSGGNGLSLRELPKTKQKEYDAVSRAIEITKRMPNGIQRLQIIDLVYWKRTHTVEGAAMKVGYSVDRGKQLHGEFVRLVAKCYGFLEWENTENITRKSQKNVL